MTSRASLIRRAVSRKAIENPAQVVLQRSVAFELSQRMRATIHFPGGPVEVGCLLRQAVVGAHVGHAPTSGHISA